MKTSSEFYNLSPDQILDCAEQQGFKPTGRFFQLNSYENRVYLIYLEDGEPIVGKFYRPFRWSLEAIGEEHLFMAELKAEGLPVVTPLKLSNNDTVDNYGDMYYSFYPQHKGRMPYEMLTTDIQKVARSLARLHNIGEQKDFQHRPTLDGHEFGWDDLDILEDWIDPNVLTQYRDVASSIIESYIDRSSDFPFQRVHGDCHRGNLLNNGVDLFFVDFDDSLNAPIAQDLWMVLAGDDDDSLTSEFIKSYQELRVFDRKQLSLFPLLQALRVIHYSAWIAKRWDDPSFKTIFPQFESYSYWAEELQQLLNIQRNIT